jgi:hypothetical protein
MIVRKPDIHVESILKAGSSSIQLSFESNDNLKVSILVGLTEGSLLGISCHSVGGTHWIK